MSDMDADPDLCAELNAERAEYEQQRPYWDALMTEENERSEARRLMDTPFGGGFTPRPEPLESTDDDRSCPDCGWPGESVTRVSHVLWNLRRTSFDREARLTVEDVQGG